MDDIDYITEIDVNFNQEDLIENSIPVEGKVLEECKGSFRIQVEKKKVLLITALEMPLIS